MQSRHVRSQPELGEGIGIVGVRDALLVPRQKCAVHRGREPLLGAPLRLGDRLEPCVGHVGPLVVSGAGEVEACKRALGARVHGCRRHLQEGS